jgi:hypothetical protein
MRDPSGKHSLVVWLCRASSASHGRALLVSPLFFALLCCVSPWRLVLHWLANKCGVKLVDIHFGEICILLMFVLTVVGALLGCASHRFGLLCFPVLSCSASCASLCFAMLLLLHMITPCLFRHYSLPCFAVFRCAVPCLACIVGS